MATPTTTKPAAQAATNNAPAKRLILIGGGKGGVGKSTFARALLDYYELRGAQAAAFDGDLENPTLSRFVDAAEPLATQTAEGFEALVRAMEKGVAPQIVADLGAGTQRHAAEFERLLGLGQAARDFGYVPVLVWILAPNKESIGLLGHAVQAHRDWSVVLAHAKYELGDWSLWEQSNTKKTVDAVHPETLDFPELKATAYTAIDKADLRFRDANRKNLQYIEAGYADRWFQAVCAILDKSPALKA